ncbi:MAG: site-specific integrase [bacterium]
MSAQLNHFSLYKRSNQIYYIGYYQEGVRKWKSTGASVQPDALKALTEFKLLLQKRTSSITLEKFFDEFLAYGRTIYSPKTLSQYEGIFKMFKKEYPNSSLREINGKHIDFYKAKRLREKKQQDKEQTVSPVSVNVELRMLRSAFNTARRWKLIEYNIFEGIQLARIPEQVPTFLSKSDFSKLLACIEEEWLKEIVTFAVLTGMRQGEIINLKWKHLNLQDRIIHLQSSPNFKTKQGKMRVIPLNETVFYMLQSKWEKNCSEFVFTLNGSQIKGCWLSHLFKKYVRKAKLENEKIHFHSLRHTFATWLVQDGVPIYEVQKLLGHSSISVTQVYSHLAASELHSAVNKIDLNLN